MRVRRRADGTLMAPAGVFADQIFGDGVGQGGAQASADVVEGAWSAVAALAQGTAASFGLWSVGVFVLDAALVGAGDGVDPGLQLADLEAV